MANQEHIEIFRQGKHIWNTWREKHPDIRPDLSYANLYSDDLSQMNLRGALLQHVNFVDASLVGTDLRAANYNGPRNLDTKKGENKIYSKHDEKTV